MAKKKDEVWLTRRYGFVQDPNDKGYTKELLVLEWGLYTEDKDEPIRLLLQVVDARET